MVNFRITRIDDEVWRNFKTIAAWKGKTCRDILIGFITKQAVIVKEEKAKQTTLQEVISTAGEKV
ncbi:MAG TPA: hypothetical protein VMW44_00885 [Candidatus Bathyarchaeia archaeon]|nr:hypothetical protein [Candidatus Bathyarchaeia archaeon]